MSKAHDNEIDGSYGIGDWKWDIDGSNEEEDKAGGMPTKIKALCNAVLVMMKTVLVMIKMIATAVIMKVAFVRRLVMPAVSISDDNSDHESVSPHASY